MFNPLPRFDGAEAWTALTPEQQAEIGVIALEYVVAANGRDAYADLDAEALLARAHEAAEVLLGGQLNEAVQDALAGIVPALDDEAELVPIPLRLGGVCRACACSEYDPCPEGCGWAQEDLCTSCAELAGLPAAALQPGG
jgi:hypothetical protein